MTTEVQDGRIRIYDDIYGDDKMLIDRYFRKKF
jgi:hypothetical protein